MPALGALHPIHLGCLPVDGHVLVDDPDATLPGHGDGHLALGHRVHGGRDQRDLEGILGRQEGGQGGLTRMDEGVARNQQHVIEGQALSQNPVPSQPLPPP